MSRRRASVAVGIAALATVVAIMAVLGLASAAWLHSSNGSGSSLARSMPAGNAPTTNGGFTPTVVVSWAQASFASGPAVSGYVVKSYDANTHATRVVGASCSGVISGLTCTETGVPDGSWTYTVTPVQGNNWTGTESAQSAARTVDTIPPQLVSMVMQDTNANGKVDRVVATFSETLAAYTAGNAPWTLANVPSGGILASVSVSGNQATLTLNEGGGAADTAVGFFTVALAKNANGIRDGAGNQSSFAATSPSDGAAPVLTSMVMQDANTNGKVDRVVATFSETLAAYTAGNAPWTLANVPSGGTLASVSVSGNQATLTLNEGGGAANTAVGSFTISLAANANGIRDGAGNQSSFAATAPSDGAGPVVVSIAPQAGAVTGTLTGQLEAGDTFDVTFSEPVQAPGSGVTITLARSGNANATLAVPNLVNGTLDLGSNAYETKNTTTTFGPSALTRVNSNLTIRLTLGTCTSGCTNPTRNTTSSPVSFSPSASVLDLAGTVAAGSFTSGNVILF